MKKTPNVVDGNHIAKLKEFLEITIKEQASDLHLSVGHQPVLRVAGVLVPLLKEPVLTSVDMQELTKALMNAEQYQNFLGEKEIDFSYNFEDKARFRVNVFFQREEISIALRQVPAEVKTIEKLNLPPLLHEFTKASQGFVLITGPSSHGKSTTLAALIDEINRTRKDHIITIEDPIEYIFNDDRSIIDQREVYQDTLSFSRALRSTFRQDPDVIMVGEMRDPETIAIAITAAETGHLVFATLHTNSASQSIHRIVDSFPSEQQGQVRAQLSGSLLGVISQRLVPRIKGGLIPACEIMLATPAVANLIRENKIHELPLVIETSAEKGMVSLNRALANLVKNKEISLENALNYSLNPSELKILIR
ncbi:MAG TPA: type IV pilus twitching motility protein PilT [Candidatus Paceibacterota bacterium]|nr:type IV pilus twitching motility protein PilT [Candidatus Paceibacterota bacterium]